MDKEYLEAQELATALNKKVIDMRRRGVDIQMTLIQDRNGKHHGTDAVALLWRGDLFIVEKPGGVSRT